MTRKQWNSLDEAEQIEAVWDGEFIAERRLNEYRISLYWLRGLFVQVYYDTERNFIRKFEPLETTDKEIAISAYRDLN